LGAGLTEERTPVFDEYLDFEIHIDPLTDAGYPLSVRGPGGETSGVLRLPTDDPAYQQLAGRLAALDTDEELLAQFGQILFTALFTEPIKEAYARSQGRLKDGQGLRLILDIAASEQPVAALPWEFLYDPDQGPLAMLDISVVRYLPQQAVLPTLATPLPLKVLLTGAETPPKPNVTRELEGIQAALAALGASVQVAVEPHLTRAALQRHLRDGFHIWHFVGHGALGRDGTTSVLQLEDATSDAEPVNARELNILLFRSGVRLVVLDACESAALRINPFRSIAPALIRAHVPAVVAMQFSVPEEATRAFASEFYRTLAEGFPIDACVTEGRKAVMGATGLRRPDWGIPVVYTRAQDGRLFARPAPATPPPITPGDSRPVGDGLLALRALMDAPEVYAAVAGGRDQFREVLRQIELLNRYKGLHDQFQQLEDCARLIDLDRRRLPHDLRAWADVARNEPELHGKLDDVLALAGTGAIGAGEALWTRKLARAQQELRSAVEQSDLALLSGATDRIEDVLGSVPWQINARLVEVAGGLPLKALLQNLTAVRERLEGLDLDPGAARQCAVFVQGVVALAQIDVHLARLVDDHNTFQEIDNELRRIEAGLDSDVRALVLAWPDLRILQQQVCDRNAADWATKFSASGAELERALDAQDSAHTTLIFWRYRGQAGQGFNRIDADLLALCEELQRIGRSLEFVLRTVP